MAAVPPQTRFQVAIRTRRWRSRRRLRASRLARGRDPSPRRARAPPLAYVQELAPLRVADEYDMGLAGRLGRVPRRPSWSSTDSASTSPRASRRSRLTAVGTAHGLAGDRHGSSTCSARCRTPSAHGGDPADAFTSWPRRCPGYRLERQAHRRRLRPSNRSRRHGRARRRARITTAGGPGQPTGVSASPR